MNKLVLLISFLFSMNTFAARFLDCQMSLETFKPNYINLDLVESNIQVKVSRDAPSSDFGDWDHERNTARHRAPVRPRRNPGPAAGRWD